MRVRGAISSLLVLLACAVAVAVVPVRWLDAQLHTDAYAETVRPLPRDPEVQRAIIGRVTEAMESSGQEIPPEVTSTIESKVPVVLNTPEATEIWVRSNLAARDALLRGDGGQVTVDIDELIETLSDRLRAEGVEVPAELPEHSTRVVLVDTPAVARAREGSQLTATLAPALPLAAGGLLLLALLVSARRPRTLALAGIGVSVVALVEILALQVGRDRYLATVDDATSRALLEAVVQAFSRSMRSDLLVMLLAAAAVAVGGIVLGILTRRRDHDVDPEMPPTPDGRPGHGWPGHHAEAPVPYAAPQPSVATAPAYPEGSPRYPEAPPRYAEAPPHQAEAPSRYAENPPGQANAPQPRWQGRGGPDAELPPRQPPPLPGR
jgi:hypothetical protein